MISGTVHEADPATFEDRVGEYLITPPADPPCSSLNNPNRPALRVARERAVPDEGAKLAVAEGEMDGVVDVSSAVALAPPPTSRDEHLRLHGRAGTATASGGCRTCTRQPVRREA
jgi:hypothetical protein